MLGRCEAGPGRETARHIEKCAIMGESCDNTCMIRSYSCFCAGLITLAVQEAVCSLENGGEGGGGLQMSTGRNFDRGLGAGNDKLQLVVTGTWIRTILISVLNIMNITKINIY